MIKPAKPTSPIKVFLKIINDLAYPVVLSHRAAVCKMAGNSNPRVDNDKAPKKDERLHIKIPLTVTKIQLLTNQRNELF